MEKEVIRFNVSKAAVILLAAGQSSRLGSPKQLLVFEGKTLLEHAIESARKTNANPLILVLGANRELIESQTNTEQVTVVVNPDWESGMASSIVYGLRALLRLSPETDGLILMVCDQPFANSDVLNSLLKKQQETGLPIISSTYHDILGTPVLFHRHLFPELLLLKGDTGAKKLLEKYKDLTSFVTFQSGSIDIDTVEDYNKLTK